MPIEIPKDTWPGSVRSVTIGATADQGGTRKSVVVVGGEKTMPFLKFEAAMPNRPAVAVEIKDHRPEDWSPLLYQAWGDVINDPSAWAKAAEAAGADLIQLSLSLNGENGQPTTPEQAVAVVKAILAAVGIPLIVFGPGQTDADNNLIVPIAEATKGERLVLGICEDKNYRTIVATAMANGHLVNARTPIA